MHEKINLSFLNDYQFTWREIFVRAALVFFCLALWHNNLNIIAFPMLASAWFLDNNRQRLSQVVKEPLVKGILVLCALLLLGLLWGELPEDGRTRWKKYFILLTFIPFLALLNKQRLSWVIAALLVGYFGVLFVGIYQWISVGKQGIDLFKMSYLSFSAMLGIGAVFSLYLACTSRTKMTRICLWLLTCTLLFIQSNQSARGFILATLISLLCLVLLLYRANLRKFLVIFMSLFIVITIFYFNSAVLQQRFVEINQDITASQQGDYSTNVGYRLALWDVGIKGITEQPLFGHGTGTPEIYFEKTVVTYKGGIYRELPKFHRTSHYHNDWIEIGMHLGMLGILALAFFLWCWYQSFRKHQFPVLGATLISYIFVAGLTDTFIIYSKIPLLLLVITAVIINCQETNREEQIV